MYIPDWMIFFFRLISCTKVMVYLLGCSFSPIPFELKIFRIEREGESQRYKPFKQLHNRQLLWHGSRTTNFAGILSQGLRIAPPEAPVVR